jgi:ribosome-interacting GTPase 1
MSYKTGILIASFAHEGLTDFAQVANLYCRWEKLNLVRVYTKPKGKLPDYSAPVVLRSNKCTVEDFVSPRCPRTIRTSHPMLFQEPGKETG